MLIDRRASLAILANALEDVLVTDETRQRPIIENLPHGLHMDVTDLLANVEHFLSDADIRKRDERYKQMQEVQMRNLIEALRRGESRHALLEFSFLK